MNKYIISGFKRNLGAIGKLERFTVEIKTDKILSNDKFNCISDIHDLLLDYGYCDIWECISRVRATKGRSNESDSTMA